MHVSTDLAERSTVLPGWRSHLLVGESIAFHWSRWEFTRR